jgi:hypothetical protein
MNRLMTAALLSVALSTVPAIAADPAREPTDMGVSRAQSDDARRAECQRYQGAQRDECLQGKHFGGQVGQHPSLPGGGASERQEVPGTGTTVPR